MKENNNNCIENAETLSSRQIIESLVLHPEAFVHDREQKYFLGEIVASKCLHCALPNQSEKKYKHS